MKIVMMGAGGVGGFYGGRMAKAGLDVTFIARGAHLAALRENGLRVKSPMAGDFHLPQVAATDDPASVGPVDLIWVTVKTYDLETAAQAMLPMIGPETVVIPLLNGVEHIEILGEVVGAEHVMAGTVQVSAFIAEPGLIEHVTMDRLAFGETGGGPSPRGDAIRDLLHGAGIEAELSPDMPVGLWSKFSILTPFAGMCSMARAPVGAVRDNPETMQQLTVCMDEVVALGRATGLKLPKDFAETRMAMLKGIAPETKPSMLLDLERGRRLELEALQGAIVRLGKKAGVATPVNQLVYDKLKPFVNGEG